MQLKLIGVAWPPASGWMQRVVGRVIWSDAAEQFLKLAGK